MRNKLLLNSRPCLIISLFSFVALTSAVRMSYQGTGDRPDLNNHSNQLNPNHPQFGGGAQRPAGSSSYQGAGDRADVTNNPQHGGGAQRPAGSSGYQGTGDRADLNNHSNQLNPNHPQFGGGAAGGAGRH